MLLAVFKLLRPLPHIFFFKMQFNNPQRKYAEKTAACRTSAQHKGTPRNQCTVFSKKKLKHAQFFAFIQCSITWQGAARVNQLLMGGPCKLL